MLGDNEGGDQSGSLRPFDALKVIDIEHRLLGGLIGLVKLGDRLPASLEFLRLNAPCFHNTTRSEYIIDLRETRRTRLPRLNKLELNSRFKTDDSKKLADLIRDCGQEGFEIILSGVV